MLREYEMQIKIGVEVTPGRSAPASQDPDDPSFATPPEDTDVSYWIDIESDDLSDDQRKEVKQYVAEFVEDELIGPLLEEVTPP